MDHLPYSCEILTDGLLLGRLKNEWDSLFDRQSSPHLSDSFEWASLSWKSVTSRRRRRLYCIVVRRQSLPVAIWPLVLTPGVVRVASPMNSEGSEYCPCLLDPAEELRALWGAIHQELRARREVDALRLPHVRADSRLHDLIGDVPVARATIVQRAPMVRSSDLPDPESYARGFPGKTRGALRLARRKLEEIGRVEFAELNRQERTQALRWILGQKREWLARRGLQNQQLLSEDNVDFLQATLEHGWRAGGRRVFALKLDGSVIAAEVCSVDERRVEAFHAAFDRTYEKSSPGHLLTLEIIRWALQRGLDYDFRPGTEAYKLKWASHVVPVASYLVPVSLRGDLFVRYRMTRRWLSERAPKRLRRQISKLGS